MSHVVAVQLHPEHVDKAKEELLPLLDHEVDAFSRYMATEIEGVARGALSNPEKALLKTYLVAKIRGRL